MNAVIPKIKIGMDVDGVLYQFDSAFKYLVQWKFGKVLPESTYWDSILEGLSHNQNMWMWSAGVTKHGLFRHGHLYKGSWEGLRRLSGIADIHIITHRPAQAVQDTLDWLAFQRFPIAGVNILSEGQSKATIPCQVYVDDKIDNIRDVVAHENVLGLLWSRPWNRDSGLGFRPSIEGTSAWARVSSWDEVYHATYNWRDLLWKSANSTPELSGTPTLTPPATTSSPSKDSAA